MRAYLPEIPFAHDCPDLTAYHAEQAEAFQVNLRYIQECEGLRAICQAEQWAKDTPSHQQLQALQAKHQEWEQGHQIRQKALFQYIPKDLWARFEQAEEDHWFRDENACCPQEILSPSGKYLLVVTRHPTSPGCWEYSKGKFYREGNLIGEVRRNYGQFLTAWVENHPNGGDYFIGGSDYQGQTVLRLDTGERRDYLPKSADEGFGFCWAGVHPSPDGTMLLVDGCYWACPYEIRIVDFTVPLELPWVELLRDDTADFQGWNADNTAKLGRTYEVINIPGHPLDGKNFDGGELTEAEEDEYVAYVKEHNGGKDLARIVQEEGLIWSRPGNVEAAERYARYLWQHWVKEQREVPEEFVEMLDRHLGRLAEADQAKVRQVFATGGPA